MSQVQVGVIMGSNSDWDTMQHAVEILQGFGVAFEARVVSAHRMPDDMFAYAESAAERKGFLDEGMDMIGKPFTIETLATMIRDMINPKTQA